MHPQGHRGVANGLGAWAHLLTTCSWMAAAVCRLQSTACSACRGSSSACRAIQQPSTGTGHRHRPHACKPNRSIMHHHAPAVTPAPWTRVPLRGSLPHDDAEAHAGCRPISATGYSVDACAVMLLHPAQRAASCKHCHVGTDDPHLSSVAWTRRVCYRGTAAWSYCAASCQGQRPEHTMPAHQGDHHNMHACHRQPPHRMGPSGPSGLGSLLSRVECD